MTQPTKPSSYHPVGTTHVLAQTVVDITSPQGLNTTSLDSWQSVCAQKLKLQLLQGENRKQELLIQQQQQELCADEL